MSSKSVNRALRKSAQAFLDLDSNKNGTIYRSPNTGNQRLQTYGRFAVTVKFATTCASCGAEIPKGVRAVYEPKQARMECRGHWY